VQGERALGQDASVLQTTIDRLSERRLREQRERRLSGGAGLLLVGRRFPDEPRTLVHPVRVHRGGEPTHTSVPQSPSSVMCARARAVPYSNFIVSLSVRPGAVVEQTVQVLLVRKRSERWRANRAGCQARLSYRRGPGHSRNAGLTAGLRRRPVDVPVLLRRPQRQSAIAFVVVVRVQSRNDDKKRSWVCRNR